MKFRVEYFSSKVEDAINAWPIDILADYGHLIVLLEKYGPDLGMPHSFPLGRGLFELRAKGKEGIGRAFYCFKFGQKVIVLHEIIKKSRKAPKKDLDTARNRMKEVKKWTP